MVYDYRISLLLTISIVGVLIATSPSAEIMEDGIQGEGNNYIFGYSPTTTSTSSTTTRPLDKISGLVTGITTTFPPLVTLIVRIVPVILSIAFVGFIVDIVGSIGGTIKGIRK